MKRVLPILLAAGLAAAPALADPPLPAGCWMGAVKKADGNSDYAVQVWSAPPGGKLHLSSPKSCFYTLGDKRDGKSYSLSAQSCTELDSSTFSVKADGGAYGFTIDKLKVGGTLTRDAAPDEKSCHIK